MAKREKREWKFMVVDKVTGYPESRHLTREAAVASVDWADPRYPKEVREYSLTYAREMTSKWKS